MGHYSRDGGLDVGLSQCSVSPLEHQTDRAAFFRLIRSSSGPVDVEQRCRLNATIGRCRQDAGLQLRVCDRLGNPDSDVPFHSLVFAETLKHRN